MRNMIMKFEEIGDFGVLPGRERTPIKTETVEEVDKQWLKETPVPILQQVVDQRHERQCLEATIFMQDGATPHIGRQVKAVPNLVIIV
ncbi:hypothetical protein TNCV_271441 [Trichonephila clavipes]|nr:hypothetical protein TNCV_271441 [Trichonephila clavipes]